MQRNDLFVASETDSSHSAHGTSVGKESRVWTVVCDNSAILRHRALRVLASSCPFLIGEMSLARQRGVIQRASAWGKELKGLLAQSQFDARSAWKLSCEWTTVKLTIDQTVKVAFVVMVILDRTWKSCQRAA